MQWTAFIAEKGSSEIEEEIDVTANSRYDAEKIAQDILDEEYVPGLHIVRVERFDITNASWTA